MKRRARALLAGCLTGFVMMTGLAAPSAPSARSAERLPMLAGSPLLSLRIDIEECAFDVYVNGGLVTRNMEGTLAAEDQPINHWLRSGSNEIEVYMYSDPGAAQKCNVEVGLSVKEDETAPGKTALVLAHSAKGAAAGHPTEGSSPPGTFDSHRGFRASDKGDLRVGPARFGNLTHGGASSIDVLGRTFECHLPFPEWAFFRGEKLKQGWEFKDVAELTPVHNEIMAAYGKLWSLIDKHDAKGFLDACEERSREIDLAYYRRPGETRSKLKKDLEAAMNDPKVALTPVIKPAGKFWRYSVGSKGNLIALTTGSRGSPIIRFEMKDDTPFSLIFPVVFRKECSRYIVTR